MKLISRLQLAMAVFVSLALHCHCEDIQALFEKMSYEDKCGQMTQVTFQVIAKYPQVQSFDENPIDEEKLREAIVNKKVGSILNTPYDNAAKKEMWQQMIKQIQDTASQTELKIPIIYGIDSIHGAGYIQEATLFPQPINMGATFNTEIAFRDAGFTAMETRAVGIPWNFNPVLDVGRQPLWPRFWETYGEDTYLASQLGQNYIRGHQGDNLKNRTYAATCLKHYIGYSFPFNGLDRTPAYIPENMLRETFLPPFAHAVAAGSMSVMVNSADVNGIPGHANSFYLNDILKGELGFQGFVVSDWEDIVRLHTRDRMAETPEDAVRISVMSGLDMSMVPYDFSFYDHCVNLTNKNAAFRDRVDDATMRILRVKDLLGLFENAYPDEADLPKVGSDAAWQFALESAQESIVLAKNQNNILPIRNARKILVTGPTGNLLKVLHGGWSYRWQGDNETYFRTFGRPKQTVFDAIKSHNDDTEYVPGVDFVSEIDINAAVTAAQSSDVVILCIGEDTYTETPGNIYNLELSAPQVKLANALIATGKPIVVVYIGGRPRVMTDVAKQVNAALLAMLPGNRGGEAIGNIIFGDVNPSGRLPFTYPLTVNGFMTYDILPLESFDLNQYEYLFPFGHGLSYTTFEYSDLRLNTRQLIAPNSLSVSVTVRNSGERRGKEAVLLYLNDIYGSVPRPIRQLKKFTKIDLDAGMSQTVTFSITMDDLTFINAQMKRVYEAGDFNIFVGNLNTSFTLLVDGSATTQPMTRVTSMTTTSSACDSFRNINLALLMALIFLSISMLKRN